MSPPKAGQRRRDARLKAVTDTRTAIVAGESVLAHSTISRAFGAPT